MFAKAKQHALRLTLALFCGLLLAGPIAQPQGPCSSGGTTDCAY